MTFFKWLLKFLLWICVQMNNICIYLILLWLKTKQPAIHSLKSQRFYSHLPPDTWKSPGLHQLSSFSLVPPIDYIVISAHALPGVRTRVHVNLRDGQRWSGEENRALQTSAIKRYRTCNGTNSFLDYHLFPPPLYVLNTFLLRRHNIMLTCN